jgi:hypothetical protein
MITEDRKAFREEFIREQRQKSAVENAIASGKVGVGCREAAEKLAASNIEAFEAFVANAPGVAPVKKPSGTQRRPLSTRSTSPP